MIITCSNCETKFNLPESKIPAGGAKVKCSKCGNIFKVAPPAPEPEDEVESMLEEEQPKPAPEPKPEPKPEPEPEPESDFDDDLFDEAVDELGAELGEDPFGDIGTDDSGKTAADDSDDFEDDLFGSDDNSDDAEIGADLFDDDDDPFAESDAEEAPAEEDDFDIDDELFGGDDDVEAASAPAGGAEVEEESDDLFDDDDLFGDEDDGADLSEDNLFDDDEEVEEDDGTFAEEDFEDGEDFTEEDLSEDDVEEDDGLALDDGEIAGFDLDDEATGFDLDDNLDAPSSKKKEKKGKKGLIITLIILILFAGGAGAAWYLKLWESLPFSIPFVTSDDAGTVDSNEPPSKRFSKFSFKDLRQFYVNNDKAGQLFIIEGKVVNNFSTPKELIEVEAQLFDDKGQVLDSKRLLCGNTLSLFQLEVQSKEEIEAGLGSKVGILSNNTLLKPGMDTPFMVVFFQPSPAVKEYVINVVDAKNPPKK
ncbi:DUF3426 domain-containing protein [Maridesulfovibrio sp.]|uniref:DUF3426 domain-containing protein n=1 Tax=Maridesulfovibrio sp. TaxID=2795000 RepID=UPI002A187597|nr:DUF3426 domain-containing protein [Maridesulfovibrio sp.]